MVLQAATKSKAGAEVREGSGREGSRRCSPLLLLTSNVKAFLRDLLALGIDLPSPTLLNSRDIGVMAWLAEPHLVSLLNVGLTSTASGAYGAMQIKELIEAHHFAMSTRNQGLCLLCCIKR
jgi:hypothetical protein